MGVVFHQTELTSVHPEHYENVVESLLSSHTLTEGSTFLPVDQDKLETGGVKR